MSKKVTKKQKELRASWESILDKYSRPLFSKHKAKVGSGRITSMPEYSYRGQDELRNTPSLTSSQGIVYKRSIMDPMSLSKEKPDVANAILQKSKRIAPAYSKGAYQYVTDETNPAELGRKL